MRKRRARRRLSMTSLIDVIFLLLLFFMLSSAFTRFAEVDLTAAGAGGAPGDSRPVFLQLAQDSLTLNGRVLDLDALAEALAQDDPAQPQPLLVALKGDVDAQRLTDLLVVLRGIPGLSATVMEAA